MVTRRDFLKTTLLTSAAAPTLLLPRFARATDAFGAAEHVLVLFAKGGFRSHATFNAVGTTQHNPFGVQAPLGGREWDLGAACGADPIVTNSFGSIPSFASISNEVTVLTSVDHIPGGIADTDHRTATYRMCTGSPDGGSGLLSLIGRDHPMYAGGFTLDAVPPVEIGPTEFGNGTGSYAQTRPLSVFGADSAFVADKPIGKGWKMAARAAVDARFKNTRPRTFRLRLNNYLGSKQNAATFADMLKDPRLNVVSSPTGTDAGFTNAQLLEVLGDYDLSTIGDEQSLRSWGADVAMALRFFGFGTPIAVVTRDIYDMHDREQFNYAPRSKDLVRQLAGLNYLLKAMPHPTGGTYWDKTLVVVLSEFSRNNTEETGFNSGAGSDHVGYLPGPCRNQAIALMGGVIPSANRGKRYGSSDDQMVATGTVYSSKQLLSTILDVLGIAPTPYWSDAPIAELFV